MDLTRSATQDDKEETHKSIAIGNLPPKAAKNVSQITESNPSFRSMMTSASFQPLSSTQYGSELRGTHHPASVETFGLKRAEFDLANDVAVKPSSKPSKFEIEHLSSRREIPQVFRSYSVPTPAPDYKPLSIKTTWTNPKLRTIPNVYMAERSSRTLNDHEHKLEDITSNLSQCFRVLGVQARYVDAPAGVALLTPEQVEIYVYLWKTGGGKQVCVEVHRRCGDSVTFHRYARHILEAAVGDFDPDTYKDYSDFHYLKAAEKMLRTELTKVDDQAHQSRLAIELASSLIKKDRLDARVLGMESLCILTDPRKTNVNTALLASRIVLFGEGGPEFRNIHEFVLNIVQRRCMGDEDVFLKDMVVEYDSDDEDFFEDDELKDESKPPEYLGSIKTLLNYGLTILANSWEVLSTFESFDSEPETTHGNLLSGDAAVGQFQSMALDFTQTDILTSLLAELGRAEKHAHNACLAAKCLRILCQASQSACQRTKALSGWECACRAEQVGEKTNVRLQRESTHLLSVLQE
ncbi:hypothetical protein MHU86_3441 [Fragilaria crotonensis]|nr:hypothetical protein MHU86_3441 [Fragilaria crotonensis]